MLIYKAISKTSYIFLKKGIIWSPNDTIMSKRFHFVSLYKEYTLSKIYITNIKTYFVQ